MAFSLEFGSHFLVLYVSSNFGLYSGHYECCVAKTMDSIILFFFSCLLTRLNSHSKLCLPLMGNRNLVLLALTRLLQVGHACAWCRGQPDVGRVYMQNLGLPQGSGLLLLLLFFLFLALPMACVSSWARDQT